MQTRGDRSLSSLCAPSILPPAADTNDRVRRFSRRERTLLVALLVSLLLHLLGGTGAIDWLADLYRSDEPEPGPPLRAVLMPPPPPVYQAAPASQAPSPRPKPRPHRHVPPPPQFHVP